MQLPTLRRLKASGLYPVRMEGPFPDNSSAVSEGLQRQLDAHQSVGGDQAGK